MILAEVAADGAETIEMLCRRVGELEVALRDVCDEALMQGDSSKPRPALVRGRAVLLMQNREARS